MVKTVTCRQQPSRRLLKVLSYSDVRNPARQEPLVGQASVTVSRPKGLLENDAGFVGKVRESPEMRSQSHVSRDAHMPRFFSGRHFETVFACRSFVTPHSDPGSRKWRAGTPAATKS